MAKVAVIRVQVCYATADSQALLDLEVAAGTTLLNAVMQSGIIAMHPEIDVSVCKVGIHGKIKQLDAELRDGDRVEIYRPLIADPMEARRRRAKKQRG